MTKRILLLVIGLSYCLPAWPMSDPKIAAALEKVAARQNDEDDEQVGPFWGWGGRDYYRNGKMTRARELLQLLRKLPAARREANAIIAELKQAKDTATSEEDRKDLELRIEAYSSGLKSLEEELAKQSTFGRAIARGLAGTEWKAIEDESVKNVWDGLALGLALRASNEAGNALGKRIANSVDRVAGGAWDYLVNKLIDAWYALSLLIWSNAPQRFEIKELLGWQDHLKICFDGIGQLLKDGLKDSLRGKDSTLRKVEDSTTVEETQAMNVWRILIDGYVRQIDFLVNAIDQHLEAYKDAMIPEPQVVMYAQELRRRLVEFQTIIVKPKNLKELDGLLDSNRTLMQALRQNIDSLLVRLINAVEPVAGGGNGSAAGRVGRLVKPSAGDDEEAKFPGSFRNW